MEFALVLPLLVLLVFGIVDYGRTFADSNTLVRSAESAARSGATQGPDRYADYNALQSVEASLSALDSSEIERVVIFRSDTADGEVPAACADAVISDDLNAKGIAAEQCNIYSRAQIEFRGNVLNYYRPTCADSWDAAWCPTTRSRGTDLTDPDYLGVFIKVRYTAITGIIGAPTTDLTATAVFRLDPCITGVSCD